MNSQYPYPLLDVYAWPTWLKNDTLREMLRQDALAELAARGVPYEMAEFITDTQAP